MAKAKINNEISPVPRWLSEHLKTEDLARIEAAVVDAEQQTSAEIVPMIVKSSMLPTDRGRELWLHVVIGLMWSVMAIYTYCGEWTFISELGLGVSILFYLGSLFFKVPLAVSRFFAGRTQLINLVHIRAELEFHRRHFNKTEHGTGVLIFLSLEDRHAVVLAGESIVKKMPSDIWDQLIQVLVMSAKEGRLADGFCLAITKAKDLLKVEFPVNPADVDELQNALIIKE
jgi:putative membrane protein